MKKVLSIILVIMLIASLFILTGCSKKEDNDGQNSKNANNSNLEYSWPDLEEYDIPSLNKGSITELVDNGNKDNYKLNYDVTVNSVKKSDIENYVKSFDSSWTVSELDNTYILVSSDNISKYSVVINFDEENSCANISISSL